ncbi:MAG: Crp/Fnr family transcriptional regulator [Pseudomonadota bacterium]
MNYHHANCEDCAVRNTAICSALSSDELAVLNSKGRMHRLSAGQTLVWEGDESLLVANVLEGVMKLSTSMGDGREQIVGIVYPSDFIGRPFGGRSLHSLTALTDAHLCAFSRRDFDSFAREHPDLEHKLLDRTLTELDRARHWMLLLGRKTAPEKTATFLLEMADRLSSTSPETKTVPGLFELPFGRQQIADILGMTIETVSRQLSRLKKEGIIVLPDRRHIQIVDRDRLAQQAEIEVF